MKKVLFLFVVVSGMLYSFSAIAPATWEIDHAHSQLRFSISHLMISEVEGTFKITEASITSSKDDFSDAAVYVTADVNSINTNNADRDTHLKNPDFFDAAKFPTIVFKSTSFEKVSGKKYKVKGNLTMHGVTRLIELDAIANVGINPMSKKTVAGFKVTGTIKRTDFGIAPSTPSAMLGDEVAIVANAEFEKELN